MSETARTDGIIDDLVWCGRQLYHYEQPMMLPLSEESFRCYETARQMIERYRRDLAAERERADRNQEDAERLDWMDSHGFTAYREIDPEDGQLSDHATCVSEHHSTCGIGRFGHVATTIRAAIDAARRK